MTQSRAEVFFGSGQRLQTRTFAKPVLQSGEILVRVSCCTLCRSDVHSFQGHRVLPTPLVLGHEIIGRVESLGISGARDFLGEPLKIGDRITWSIAANCGTCFNCLNEIPQKCDSLFKYGHETIDERHSLSGGLAEHCHLTANTAVVRLPDELDDHVACPANCATATVAAALRIVGGCAEKNVLIQGAGMLGLTACAMARSAEANSIIVTDVNDQRLKLGERFGADHVVLANDENLSHLVDEISKGRGLDLAIELCGTPDAVENALPLLRIGGRYLLAGAVFPTRPFSASAELIVRRMLTIRGLHNYAPQDLVTAVDFLSQNQSRFPFSDLIDAEFPLSQSEQAFQHAIDSNALRVAVTP